MESQSSPPANFDVAALLQRYVHGPALLRSTYAALPAKAHAWRPDQKSWSPRMVVCHCADSEMNSAMRLRYVLAEDKPLLVGYDQDRWARELHYSQLPVSQALSAIEAARSWTVALLERVSPDQWSRSGVHTERGLVQAWQFLEDSAQHLETHARQLERLGEAYASSQRKRSPAL